MQAANCCKYPLAADSYSHEDKKWLKKFKHR